LGKILVNFMLTGLVMVVVVPIMAVMLHVDLGPHAGIIAGQVALGTLAFAVVGTPLAVVAVNARFAEVLLPMVIFPMVTPVLIAGVKATGIVLGTSIGEGPGPWMSFMAAFVVFFGTMGLFLFDRMVTE
jgi:heme exporter protein B